MSQADEEMKGERPPNAEDVQFVQRRKALCYEVIARNEYDLPALKAPMVT